MIVLGAVKGPPISWAPSIAIAQSYSRKTGRPILALIHDPMMMGFGYMSILEQQGFRSRLEKYVCVVAETPEEIKAVASWIKEPFYPTMIVVGPDGTQLDMMCGASTVGDVRACLDAVEGKESVAGKTRQRSALWLARRGKLEEAHAMLDSSPATEDRETAALTYLSIGEQRHGVGDSASAIGDFRRAVDLTSDRRVWFRASLRLISAQIRTKRYSGARQDLAAVLARNDVTDVERMMFQRMQSRLDNEAKTKPGATN